MSYPTAERGSAITTDGTYVIASHPPGLELIVELGGLDGGGTITVGYLTIDGIFRAYPAPADPDAALTLLPGKRARVLTTSRGFVMLDVEGSSEASLLFSVYPVLSSKAN